MRRVLASLMVVLLLAMAVQSQEPASDSDLPEHTFVDSPRLAVLVHHPYPDASDPLGVEYRNTGVDAYWHRYQHLDTDGVRGFDFPHTVFDGVVAIEGIPAGDGPFVATKSAYESAIQTRAAQESPITLGLSIGVRPLHPQNELSQEAVYLTYSASTEADLSSDDLQLWAAIVEDPVHYEPPQALSNGVFVHPFVVRSVQHLGPLQTDGLHSVGFPVVKGTGPDAWNREHLGAVVWVQQGPKDGLRFDAHEVVQAVMEMPAVGTNTNSIRATDKVVLMEMYSATWCDTCLFGDKAAEELAVQYGVVRDLEPDRAGYLVAAPWIPAVLLGLLAAAAVAWPRLPGGRSE